MEVWKDIKGYEGYYQVSTEGRVRSLDRVVESNYKGNVYKKRCKGRVLSIHDCRGYNIVSLGKGSKKRLCRIVAMTFIDNPMGKPCVNHKDGNKRNDSVGNLEWVTYSENMIHAYENNLTPPPPISHAISVLCTKSGKEFSTILEAAKYIGISASQLSRKLRGIYTNDTSLIIKQ